MMPSPAAEPTAAQRAVGSTVRTFVVDDHPAFLRTVLTVIDASQRFEVVGTAATGEAAVDALSSRTDVDLVLLDVNLPDTSGIDVARHLDDVGVAVVVILMSTTERHDLRADAFERGVAGFLSKETLSTSSIDRLWREATDTN